LGAQKPPKKKTPTEGVYHRSPFTTYLACLPLLLKTFY
jgi:hypothetical protein